MIGLSFPNDYDGTRLEVRGSDSAETAVEIALFIHYLPKLMGLFQEEGLSEWQQESC